ncbi:polysaccharide biosynthesis tyrosine autokinase [Nostoc sp. FACHB-133]|uniref:GumC family protein n=1 Tax=Nostoc sp. FACHB-133 TaxID=2692835 RepID=UPI001682DB98|nr:polysaccharide biosynthesis tyrosine autokinase [Nostoc sp. FACHB-133]MBD2526695.1 polysaccharide biosynthesis tyrosine autokinase [Nostoc sp. FACHB-133]
MRKDISSLLKVLKRRSLPATATFVSVIGGSVIYLAVTPRLYETSGRLILDEKQVSVSQLGRELSQVPLTTPGGSNPLATQAELIKSQQVLQKVIAKIDSPKKITTAKVSENLKVKIIPATNILELSYRSPNAILAAKVLNAISETMVKESADAISSEAHSVRQFLEVEVPKQRSLLKRAEAAESIYRQKSGIVSIEDQTRTLVDSLATLENQQRTLMRELQEIQSRTRSLEGITKAGNLKNAYSAVRGGDNEELKKLRDKLVELEAQVVEARVRFTENHPTLLNLIERRDDLRQLYIQKLALVSPNNRAIAPEKVAKDQLSQNLTSQLITQRIERSALENKLKTVQAQRVKLQASLVELPIKQKTLNGLVRQRQEAADSLKFLQTKFEEARIAEAQIVSNIRIIAKATVPDSPASPKQAAVLVIAIFFGMIFAVGVVLLLEVLDNTLRDASQAEELLKLPLLGILPRLTANTLKLDSAESFLNDVGLVEPYRMLLKTLEFRSRENLQLIVVSSALSGEGKSIVVSHLATVSAMLSRRTLIIDADLHRPVQHQLFNLAATPGISDVLENNQSLLDVIRPTAIDNLSVLSCGELHHCPPQLLESTAMKSLIAEATAHFDLVIIDTPPLCASIDAATLTQQSHGIMLVTRPGWTHKEVLQKTVSELTENGIPILGGVVNDMATELEKYYRNSVNKYQSNRRLTALGLSNTSSDEV